MTLPAELRAEADRPYAPGINAYRNEESTRALLHRAADALEAVAGAEQLCRIYFEIAAETIGEDAVRQRRDTAIAALPATPEGV